MGESNVNKSWWFFKAGLFIIAAIVQFIPAGISRGQIPSRLKDKLKISDPNTEKSPVKIQNYVPGEVIVKLKSGQGSDFTSYSAMETQDKSILLRLQNKYELHDEVPVFKGVHQRLKRSNTTQNRKAQAVFSRHSTNVELSRFYILKTDQDVLTICNRLKNDPDLEYAQPNYKYRICAEPNDPDFPDQYAHQLIEMSSAWDISTGSHDVVVAVLDTGVDINHPDLKNNIWINEDEIPDNGEDDDENGYIDDIHGWNFENNDNKVTPEGAYSLLGHGTEVSGVIAAEGDNGIGVSGVNWQCSIMALRLSLEVTSAEVAEGLNYAAANNAHILNMSFGSDEFGPEGDPLVREAIEYAYAQGILLVASAGNADTTKPNYPAAYYNVMAVASSDGADIKTGHSSFGSWVDISAPGTDIVTTDLDGEYIATAGTSFSSPYVAAVGALVLAYRPELTNWDIRAILENTTDPIYYELVNPDEGYIGTGRVNAYQALLDADIQFPLGEIVEPNQAQIFESDVNSVPIVIFVHGDTYRLEYSQYGSDDWVLITEGAAPTEPNGLVHLSLDDPAQLTFELRLSVTSDGYTHIDRKILGVAAAEEQSFWPKPEEIDLTSDTIEISMFYGASMCMDIDGDGRNEIIQSQDVYGLGGRSLSYYGGMIAIWNEDGTPLPGWPQGDDSTSDVPQCAVGDIDGDGDYEVIGTYQFDGVVCAWHVENGELLEGDWPLDVGYWYGWIVANPVLADLDGDGDSEIIVSLDLETSSIDGLYAIQDDGTFLWQRRYTTVGAMSVADFDQDGNVEIALSGYGPGMSTMYTYILDNQGQQIKRWRGGSNIGTAITDLDADGQFELIYCTEDSVEAVHIDGRTVWSTDIDDPFGASGSLSVGDIDNDGYGEVYIATYVESDGYSFTVIHAFDHEGRLLTDAGYPKIIMGITYSNPPLLGDVDGDGQKELVAGMSAAPVIAWEPDGSTSPGFPMLGLWTELGCIPSLGDLDLDGDMELMVGGYDYRFHVIDLPGLYDPNTIDWSMSRYDPQCSGWNFKAPKLDPLGAPAQIRPGERLEMTLSASNPTNVPLQFFVGNLPEGAYYDPNSLTIYWKPAADQVFHTITFSAIVTDGIRQSSRSASVTVVPDAIYYTDMTTDPNWELDEGWAWGIPVGQGSWNGDPNSGYTGESVIGYQLEGDYNNYMETTQYATLGPVNCGEYRSIKLSFWRWLGIESPYDRANIQVSNDGADWVDIWTVGNSHISDSTWQLVEYSVPSSVADEQQTVYFRWGIGPTDDSVTYPGWNIDDVQVTGEHI
jgi:subtilisin family serine protease